MIKHFGAKAGLLATVFLLTSTLVTASNTFYEQDFESGIVSVGVASPVWSMAKSSLGPLIGPGNMFEVVSGNAHTGQYSLRFNYDGLNGVCNLCGGATVKQKAGNDNVPFFIDDEGIDLTQDPIFAAQDRFVFNKNDGFSKWRIVSVDSKDALNDKLSLEKILDGIDGTPGQFNSGDSVLVSRVCGVDGTIGGNINRRSDCNRAIAYFGGVSQKPGESIYRRLYFKIDKESTLPGIQKLRYWVPAKGSLYVTLADQAGYPFPVLQVGGVIPGMPRMKTLDKGNVEPGIWYYLEEQFKAETSLDANDGEYRLWFSESGRETNVPLLEYVEIGLKPVNKASFWGNYQHGNDAHGYWYIDDFKIGNIRIGPESAIAPPNPPTLK